MVKPMEARMKLLFTSRSCFDGRITFGNESFRNNGYFENET